MLSGVKFVPSSIALGDLNADGKLDIVTPDANCCISVLINKGGGSFYPRHDYPIARGVETRSVAIGDLNGDRKLDIVTANAHTNTVSVFLNMGRGNYRAHVDYRAGRGPEEVAIADLDSDGKLDVIAANWGGNTVSNLLGRGDGTLGSKVSYRTARGPVSVAVDDLNGDDKPDIAVAARVADYVSVLLNRGDGTFEPRVDYRVRGPRSMAIGDLDGNGRPDLVTANISTNSASVLLNQGHGTFAARVDYPSGGRSTSVAIGDLNGDRKPELAVDANVYCGTEGGRPVHCVSVLVGNGGASFQPSLFYANGNESYGGPPRSLAIGDVNGDGRADLVTAGVNRGVGEKVTSSVSVLTASTAPQCVVPNVRGQTLAAAKHALRGAHCRVAAVRWYRDGNVPQGRVVKSQPVARTVQPSFGKVALEISSGP
jgi:hypothetical protein